MVEKEDDPESWRQVAALGSMAGLLKDQRSRLEAAKQKLVEAWPPGENRASAAFVELIDDLLFNMQRNREIADSNAAALGRIVEALRQAKADIDPIYQAYLEKSDDWVPAWWDSAEDELDEKARERMRAAERIIALPDNTITAPPEYELKPDFTRTKIDDSGESATGEPAGVQSGLGSVGSVSAGSDFTVPHEPPPPVPGKDSVPPGGLTPPVSAGPELAGVVTPGNVPGSVLPTGLPPSAGTAVSTGPGLVIGGGIPLPSTLPRTGGSAVGRGRFGGSSPGLPSGSGVRNGVPASGVVGGKPATPPWLPPASVSQAKGGPTAAGRGSGGGSPPLPLGGGRGRQGEGREGMTFDPDNPWATAEGVDPVIEPSRQIYHHDPGPGVIGPLR
jgi:hypothetical protein